MDCCSAPLPEAAQWNWLMLIIDLWCRSRDYLHSLKIALDGLVRVGGEKKSTSVLLQNSFRSPPSWTRRGAQIQMTACVVQVNCNLCGMLISKEQITLIILVLTHSLLSAAHLISGSQRCKWKKNSFKMPSNWMIKMINSSTKLSLTAYQLSLATLFSPTGSQKRMMRNEKRFFTR